MNRSILPTKRVIQNMDRWSLPADDHWKIEHHVDEEASKVFTRARQIFDQAQLESGEVMAAGRSLALEELAAWAGGERRGLRR
jgi:hypothetical protein